MREYIFLTLLLLSSCIGGEKSSTKPKNEQKEVTEIQLLICGRGRSVEVDPQKGTAVIPDSVNAEVYLLEINASGYLKTTYGFGSLDARVLKINEINKTDSVKLQKKQARKIKTLSKEVFSLGEYQTKSHPTDSWLINLSIDGKKSIFYSGQSYKGPAANINYKYIELVDLIISQSPIIIKEYP